LSLQQVPLDKVVEGCPDLCVDLSCWNQDLRAGGLIDTFTFAALVKARAPKSYFEIGTGFGRSATLAALNTPPDADVRTMCIDYLDNPRIGWIFREHALAGKIHATRGDSRSFSFDPWWGKIDFVFIDGAHDFEAVSNDTKVAFRLVAPGGWIVWHDLSIDCPGVARALQASGRANEIVAISGSVYACFRDSGAKR
jgi:predicted O-methyltransferase YrrM